MKKTSDLYFIKYECGMHDNDRRFLNKYGAEGVGLYMLIMEEIVKSGGSVSMELIDTQIAHLSDKSISDVIELHNDLKLDGDTVTSLYVTDKVINDRNKFLSEKKLGALLTNIKKSLAANTFTLSTLASYTQKDESELGEAYTQIMAAYDSRDNAKFKSVIKSISE